MSELDGRARGEGGETYGLLEPTALSWIPFEDLQIGYVSHDQLVRLMEVAERVNEDGKGQLTVKGLVQILHSAPYCCFDILTYAIASMPWTGDHVSTNCPDRQE
jgi:hypothetical protein